MSDLNDRSNDLTQPTKEVEAAGSIAHDDLLTELEPDTEQNISDACGGHTHDSLMHVLEAAVFAKRSCDVGQSIVCVV